MTSAAPDVDRFQLDYDGSAVVAAVGSEGRMEAATMGDSPAAISAAAWPSVQRGWRSAERHEMSNHWRGDVDSFDKAEHLAGQSYRLLGLRTSHGIGRRIVHPRVSCLRGGPYLSICRVGQIPRKREHLGRGPTADRRPFEVSASVAVNPDVTCLLVCGLEVTAEEVPKQTLNGDPSVDEC